MDACAGLGNELGVKVKLYFARYVQGKRSAKLPNVASSSSRLLLHA